MKMKSTTVIHAPVLRRLGALLIDLFILDIFIWQQFAFLFPKSISMQFTLPQDQIGRIMTGIITITIYTLLYFILFEMKFQQTIGQWIMKIKVVYQEKKKEQPQWLPYLINNLFLIPVFPFSLLWFLEPMYMLFFNQRFLEKLSGCKTLYEVRLG